MFRSIRFRTVLVVVIAGALAVIAWSGAARSDPALPCARFSEGQMPAATPRSDSHAVERLARINQLILSAPHSVLFLGDSLTEGWSPDIWQQYMAPRGVLNAGISGDRTDHLLWRLERGNLAGPPLKAVILLIGTNDLASGRPPELTADGIRADLALLRRRLPQAGILLLGLLPREELPTAPLRRAVAQVNNLIRDCADGERVGFADIGGVLLDGNGRLTAAISTDRLHLTERGYALLAARLGPALDRLLAAWP